MKLTINTQGKLIEQIIVRPGQVLVWDSFTWVPITVKSTMILPNRGCTVIK